MAPKAGFRIFHDTFAFFEVQHQRQDKETRFQMLSHIFDPRRRSAAHVIHHRSAYHPPSHLNLAAHAGPTFRARTHLGKRSDKSCLLLFLPLALPDSLLSSLLSLPLLHKHTSGQLSAASCKGHFVFERLGGARTSLAAYDTLSGACLKQLPAQASNDGISSVSAAHPGHGVSPRSLRPGRQTPAAAPSSAPSRSCRVWKACRRSWRNSSGLCEQSSAPKSALAMAQPLQRCK